MLRHASATIRHTKPKCQLFLVLLLFCLPLGDQGLHAAESYSGMAFGRDVRFAKRDLKQVFKHKDTQERCLDHLLKQDTAYRQEIACLAIAGLAAKNKRWDLPERLARELLSRQEPHRDLLAADLLVKTMIAFGESKMDELPHSTLVLAAELLEHPDPVVQALGEWTISLRVKGNQTGPRKMSDIFQRNEANAAWYDAWMARPAEQRLDDDYARQLVQLLGHMDLPSLLEEIAYRKQVITATLAGSGGRSVPEAVQKAHDDRLQEALDACERGVLAPAHQAYIALRHAGRAVIMAARSEFPHEGFVFSTEYEPKGGGNNVNAAVNQYGKAPVGDILIKRSADPAVEAESLLKGRPGPGSFHGIDLEWEGKRLAFSHWSRPLLPDDRFGYEVKTASLYVLDLENDELTRITNAPGNNDIEPCFLPDGGFFFASDRSNFGNQCAGAFHQDKRCTTLYRYHPATMDQPIAISNNKDFDRFPSVLADGTIAFMHWEYQERGFYNQHTVWRCRPDGTNMDALYKQHIPVPMSIRTVKQVPNSTLLVGTAQGHHNGHQGPVILIDPAQGINNSEAMWTITPGIDAVEGGIGPLKKQIVAEGGVRNRGGLYIDPFPMSDKAFVVGHDLTNTMYDFGIYYIDVWGNRELLHRDQTMGAYEPFPLRPRVRPPVVADTVRPDQDHAVVFVENVYNDLPGVEKGAVKYLRLSQKLFLPAPVDTQSYDFNHLHWLPGGVLAGHLGCWSWGPARTIGTVAMEEDGSAFFKVPAGTPVYLQALDENHCEVRRMRSSFTLQRGEFRGCVGCHESRQDAVQRNISYPSELLSRGPAMPEPPPWGINTVLDYETHVQPVFDQHCVSCHGPEQPKAGLEFSSRKIGGFMQSYRTIFGLKPGDPTPIDDMDIHNKLNPDAIDHAYLTDKAAQKITKDLIPNNKQPGQLVFVSDRMSREADITMPYQFGSNRSKLIRTLLDDPMHRDKVKAKISEEDWLKLVTWVDNNADYYSTVMDKSRYNPFKDSGTIERVPFVLPSPWVPADVNPSFHNQARLTELEAN
jgi:hypothetical protein